MVDVSKSIIEFNYSGNEVDEIKRNLVTLYSTAAGTVPLDREFGLDPEFISYPIDVAQNMIALEITEKTEKYEPRVVVEQVTFESSIDGIVIPTILLARADMEEEGDE